MASQDLDPAGLKKKGDKRFAEKDYEGAVALYTQALEQCPTNHKVYSNRSFARNKLGQYQDALEDADQCILLEPGFARGYLRRCVALNKLQRYKEALVSAQEGYKLHGSEVISRDCIDQWVVGAEAIYEEKAEEMQKKLGFEFPKLCVVISDECFTLLLSILMARMTKFSVVPVNSMIEHSFAAFMELNRQLRLFGLDPCPHDKHWIGAVLQASAVDRSTKRVPPRFATALLSKSELVVTWLDKDVDPILYPVLRPALSLVIAIVSSRFISLNYVSTDQHVAEVNCRACLPFFEKSILSAPEYAEQHITILKERLEAVGKSIYTLSEEEVRSIGESIKTLEKLLKENPKCKRDVSTKAVESIGLARVRLNQDPEVLSVVEKKEEVLKGYVEIPLGDPLPESAMEDAREILGCTGALLRAGKPARAAEIFALGELVFTRLLQRQILNKTLSLDNLPDTLGLMKIVILASAKSFLGTNDKLVADTIIRWKCIFTELRALLMQFGIKTKFLATFKAIQEVQVSREVPLSEVEDRLTQLAQQHEREIHQVLCTKGTVLLAALLKQKHEEVQDLLRPGHVFLDYCPCWEESSHLKHPADSAAEKESDGLLLVLQATGAPVIKRIDLKLAAGCAHRLIDPFPKCRQEEAIQLIHKIRDLLIPTELQTILASGVVEKLSFCSDPIFSQVPLDLLPLPGEQLLGERCSVVCLSAAREVLRKATLTVAQGSLSETEKHGMSVKEGDDAVEPPDAEHPQIPAKAAKPGVPSMKQCLIFADPNFDLEQCTSERDPGAVQALVASMSSLFLKPPQPPTGPVPCLPKTSNDAHEIERNLSTAKNPLSVKSVLGDEATLASVLAVNAPFVLHFSTHSFSKTEGYSLPGDFWDDTKCGLLLAGANTYCQGDMSKVTNMAGTGELTTRAIMGMNLDGTRLVYLSLCQSAKDPVASGKTANSVAQAFRAAGAKTVVVTVWSVLDDEAQKFAVHFYLEACQTAIRPSQALVLAKYKMHGLGYKWDDWNSFVCVGEDVPLFSPAD